jgi:hypothetical protein
MQKKLLAVAIASVFGLAGCGGGSSSSDGGSSSASTTSLSGTANKGIVQYATVEVCEEFDSAGCTDISGADSYYQETETGEDGKYSISGAPQNTSLLVVVSKDTDDTEQITQMKCDVAGGCDGLAVVDANYTHTGSVNDKNADGTIDFGEWFEVADDWELTAILPAANENTESVNVTSLTDIAAKKAIETANGGKVTKSIADNANNAIQEAFGITTDITTVGALDITDPEQVATASPEEKAATAYSAAFIDVSETDKAGLLEFDGSTGGYTVSSTTTITVDTVKTNVKTELADIETQLKTKVEEEGLDLDIDTTDAVAEIASSVTPAATTPVEVATEVEEAKAFVLNVRTAYNSVQDGGDLSTGVESFASKLNGMDQLASADFDGLSYNVMLATNAMGEAVEHVQNLEDGETVPATYTTTDSSITVTISGSTYSVDANGVKLSATLTTFDVTDEETQDSGTYEEHGTANVNISINSLTATYGKAELTAAGSAKVVDFAFNHTDTHLKDGFSYSHSESEDESADSVSLALTGVKLTYDTDTSYEGSLSLSAKGYSWSDEGTWYNDSSTANGSSTEELTATSAAVVFNGKLTSGDEDASVYLSVSFDNSLGYVDTFSEVWTDANGWVTGDPSEETADKYVQAHVIARVGTNLVDASNEAMAASVELDVDRKAYETADVAITVDYNNVDTIIEGTLNTVDSAEGTISDVVVRSTTGVRAEFDDIEAGATGQILVDGVKAATIEETSSGVALVRYTDGTFETLF